MSAHWFHDHIEDYINEELNEQDRLIFENHLKNHPENKLIVDQFIATKQKLEALRIKNKVQVAIKSHKNNFTTFKVAVIAAFLMIGITGFWLFMPKGSVGNNIEPSAKTTNDSTIYQKVDAQQAKPIDSPAINKKMKQPIAEKIGKNKKHEQNNSIQSKLLIKYLALISFPVLRTDEDKISPQNAKILDEVKVAISEGYFKKASLLLQQLKNYPDQEVIRFYSAYCYFQLNQMQSAEPIFKSLTSSFQFGFDAEWNFFLCLLANDKRDEAKRLQAKIESDRNHPYYKKVVALKNEIKF